MNTEQTLKSAENHLENQHLKEEERECEHEFHQVAKDRARDGTEFVTVVCIHCNSRRRFEV